MKTFKDLKTFARSLIQGMTWEDTMKIGGRVYQIYEYGPGPGENMGYDYIYFLNKRTNDLIYIKYDCPASNYIDGKRVQTKEYKFHELELQQDAFLWR